MKLVIFPDISLVVLLLLQQQQLLLQRDNALPGEILGPSNALNLRKATIGRNSREIDVAFMHDDGCSRQDQALIHP